MIRGMVHKNLHIDLVVKSLISETPDYWSIFFHRPVNFHYEAGDWIDIEFPGVESGGGKTYSLSSSPTDPDLRITFREGVSPLKKALRGTKPGDKLVITQYGNDYGFQLRANKSSVLIAGGVGIAPFRSMLKEMFDQNSKNSVQLIYLNQTEEFLFKEQLEEWKNSLPNLKIDYVATQELNRKKREKLLISLIGNPSQQFYIAGPPGMVESTTRLIASLGVQDRDVKTDIFGGY